MNKNYLDINSKFNEKTFDKWELFYAIEELLHKNKIPCDDFKGNISVENEPKIADWDEDSCRVHCTFSWIIYNNDLKEKSFKSISSQVEKLFKNQFKLDDDKIEFYKYKDSSYALDGYDVELILRLNYKFEEE